MLELRNAAKQVRGEYHIHPSNLTLERGTLNVLLGPTLSGKTSLMRLMAGLDQPTQGSVWFDGQDVTGVKVQSRNVAMVYQQFINYPAMTVYENIASPMRLSGKSSSEIDAAVRKTAELLKLAPYLDRTPLNLSGGQQQRTALARAIVKGASLVLLDEPLANLDYKLREELRAELPKIFSESGAIFVYATTEPSEALLLGGNTATLHEGRITQFGPTVDVYRKPADLVTAQTFADPPLNVMAVEKRGNMLTKDGQHVLNAPAHFSAIPDGALTVGFHPHHLALAPQYEGAEQLKATSRICEITGSESFVHLTFAGAEWVMLAHGIHDFDTGAEITMFVDTRHLLAFDASGRSISATAGGA